MKHLRWIIPVLIIGGLIAVSLIPQPVPVDLGEVARERMTVTVEVEGVTRVRDLFLVAAPVSGRAVRIELKEGDQISEGSPITTIYPAQMNPAQRAELEAQIGAIEASKQSAEANVAGLRDQLSQARKEEERLKGLLDAGAIPQQRCGG